MVVRMLAAALCVLLAVSATATAQTLRWVKRSVPGPSPRAHLPMAFDSVRGECVLFSGFMPTSRPDTWVWNGSTWTERMAPGPFSRSFHAMAFDSARGVVVMRGGRGSLPQDTWEWNGAVWNMVLASTNQQSNVDSTMAFDSLRQRSVLIGGQVSGVFRTNEEWDGSVWTSLQLPNTPSGINAGMCYDSRRGVCVLFGPNSNSAWEYDGSAWIHRPALDPPLARSEPGIAYDSARGVTVLFGGLRFPLIGLEDYSNDTWEWNGTAWTRLNIVGPSARAEMAMAYDSIRQRVVLFGGRGSYVGFLNDTWELGPACPECPADINCDGAATTEDVLDYVNAWFTGAALADFDGLNGVTVVDIFEFLNAWLNGC